MKTLNKNTAFTLIELLVVVSTVAMLASIVLASVKTAQASARDSRRTSDLNQFKNALELHALDHHDTYPSVPTGVAFTSTGVVQLDPDPSAGTPTCGDGNDWTDGDANGEAAVFKDTMKSYISSLPKDPLNNKDHCYIYVAPDVNANLELPDVATAYAEFETGVLASQPAGVIVGNTLNFPNLRVPPLALVIGAGTSSAGVVHTPVVLTCTGTSDILNTNEPPICPVGPSVPSCTTGGPVCPGNTTEPICMSGLTNTGVSQCQGGAVPGCFGTQSICVLNGQNITPACTYPTWDCQAYADQHNNICPTTHLCVQ